MRYYTHTVSSQSDEDSALKKPFWKEIDSLDLCVIFLEY